MRETALTFGSVATRHTKTVIPQTAQSVTFPLFTMLTVAGLTCGRQAVKAAVTLLKAVSICDASGVVSAAHLADAATWDRGLFGTMTTMAAIFTMPTAAAMPLDFLFVTAIVLIVDQLMQQVDCPCSDHKLFKGVVIITGLCGGRGNCGNQGGDGDNTGYELGRHRVLLSGIFVFALRSSADETNLPEPTKIGQ
ncbi:hypothetical protein [Pelagimonas varians]|uniref:hypothetical protein n=1 Tax=Pelagimonas varians TaxID=696760 RepID=UPI000DA15B69|nr:hypothetical protein [Pelagimonas varians]